jgi:pilus assembly protein CpaE
VLRTIIISPNPETGEHLASVLRPLVSDVEILRIIDRYLSAEELTRVVRAHAPQVIFLGFENPMLAVETVRLLETEAPGIQVVATHTTCEPALLRDSMRAGVREFLSEPFDMESVAEALRNVQALLERKPPSYASAEQILSFLPSKAGVGATTLALNISAAIARAKENRVLLTDFDLNSGMLRFLLQLYPEYSVVDAVENVNHLDETIWPQLITSRFGMDLLHSGRVNPNLRIDPAQVTALLGFMRRNYDALVFDLSGNLERYSLEVMQESRHVFLVCTPEIPSLHLAREKMTFLRSMSMESKVSILLNRVSKRPLFSVEQVEELVGAKVLYSFSNDYYAVNRATTAAECLGPESVIGTQCADFVQP